MKYFTLKTITICLLLGSIMGSCLSEKYQPTDYVKPTVDTHQSRWFFFASAARPFGMVSLSPDTWTKGSWKSGYLYDSLHVRCFSHIHAWQMSGIPVMPTVGKMKGHLGMEAYKSSFSHDDEIVRPGYHKVYLKDYGIQAELTSTSRVGFHKYTYPNDTSKFVLFDVGAYLGHSRTDSAKVELINEYEIAGFSLMGKTIRRPKPTYVYFVARFDQPISTFGAWEKGALKEDIANMISGKEVGAYVGFDKEQSNTLQMKVAISYTSTDQARLNMDTELANWDFDEVVTASNDEWNDYLGRMMVKGGTEKQKTKFYTDLWHSLLGRKIVNDVDGKYCDMTGATPVIRQVELDDEGKPVHQQYNFDAWWGSHWTLNVLWSMVYPEIMNDFCASMVEMYRHGGLIPRGPSGGNYTYVMIGDPASSFFATAYNKGIRNYDFEKAYEGLRKNAFVGGIRDRAGYEHDSTATGGGMKYYEEWGYIPEGLDGKGMHKDGASMTLEYAYQDWCLAQMAKAMGKSNDYSFFAKRSENYRNLWNPETALIHPRNMDGSWIEEFSPIADKFNTLGFCESNSAIYTNYVPHNLDGLIDLFGGNEKYTEFLSASFAKASDNTMLAQKWVREVKDVTFSDTSPYGGYNGDEDQGQMGALGVLMACGLFQMDGGASVNSSYEITAPVFDEIEIQLNPLYNAGEKFVIKTDNNSADNVYIQSAQLNGLDWTKFSFSHETFTVGGELKLVLGKEPNKNWGVE